MVAAVAERQSSTTARYHPYGASAELFKHHEPIVIVSGPAGTGKTFGCLWRLHLQALKYPGMRGIMLRKVQEDLTASALVTYQERVLGSGNYGVRAFGGSKMVPAAFQYPNGSTLLIGGLDKADKVMSREYDSIYINEMWEISEDDLEKLTTRARWGVMPYQQVFGDTNPQGPGHHLYKRVQAGKAVMLYSRHEDNPDLFDALTGEWTERGTAYLATLDALSGFRRDRLRLGLWKSAEGVVYPAFDRQTHVKAIDCTGWGTVLGLDLGTRNPTCILTVRHSGDRLHVESEFYKRGLGSSEIEDAAIAAYESGKTEWIVVDPSAAGLILTLERRGLSVRKAVNDIIVGISRVTAALPDMTIDPSCVNLIEELETYAYPSGSRSERDVPIKANDHAADSLRYLCMELAAPSVDDDQSVLAFGAASGWGFNGSGRRR